MAGRGRRGRAEVHRRVPRAACTHRARRPLLLAGNDELVGLYNLDAGYRVNFAREEPELLLQAKDVAVAVFGTLGKLFGSGFAGPSILWLAVPALLLYVPVKMMARLRRRQVLQRQVDQLLDQMQFDRVVRPFRK